MLTTRRGFLTLAAGVSLAAAGCTSAPPSTTSTAKTVKVSLGLTYIPNVQFAPFYVAHQRGLFKAAGLEATLRHHGAQEGLFNALISGQEDVVVAGADEMMQARAQGADLVAIGQYYRQYPVVLIVPDASTIKTAADLKGRSVGVPGRYGESWFGLQVLLNAQGLTEADIKVVEIGYTQQAALAGNKVDSIIGFSNNDVVNFNGAGVAVRTIPLTSGELPLVGICLVTTRTFLDAHAAVAKSVVDTTMQAITAIVADQPQALKDSEAFIPALKADPTAKADAARTLEATVKVWTDASGKVSPTMDAAQFASMAVFMKDQGLLAAVVDPTKAMSNDYHS